ncbi:MAG TPA: hypothetical protein DDY91_11550 [Planctomycetaceae bacterium]|nr:hypothetical protein [Planctomycetaceae bacterium]
MAVRGLIRGVLLLCLWSGPGTRLFADELFEVYYPPSSQPGELVLGVTYTIWIPEGNAPLRGIIVHQHGCGTGACRGGATAAYDLHWQALARKWHCALLGPSYHQQDSENCRLWCDPRNGSDRTFLRGLEDLARISQRPELTEVPWCLWGHSGGGFWASLMQTLHPERIVAIWFRSGTAIEAWEKGEIPRPEVPEAAFRIPMMVNPGAKEREDARFRGAWTGAERMFAFYRAKNAPIGMMLDPRSGHECGDSRYVAIPFFEACLSLRLPAPGEADKSLKAIDVGAGWLAPYLSGEARPAQEYRDDSLKATWLPSPGVAQLWSQYVKTGEVSDLAPPPAPTGVTLVSEGNGVRVEWTAEADFETGLAGFVILRDGTEIARVPDKPIGRFGKGLFQSMSYHDTPEKPLPRMRYLDTTGGQSAETRYEVQAINSLGVRSTVSEAAGRGSRP